MFRSLAIPVLVAALVSCSSSAKVVREGPGWREVESQTPGQTTLELTSSDPAVLGEIARSSPELRLRAQAQQKINDQDLLCELARKESDPALRRGLVGRLHDPATLRELSEKDADEGVRQAATARAQIVRTIDAKHPEFGGWANCKPGTWVKLRVELKVNDARSTVEVVRTLVECCPEKVYMEQRVVSTGRGPQGTTGDLLSRFDVAFGRKVEDDGMLEVKGKPTKTRWVRYNFQRGNDIAYVKRWMRDEVPGGVARVDMEVTPLGEPQSFLSASAIAWEKR